MNYFKSIFIVTLLFVFPILPAHALSMGRTGTAYQEGAITWQDIYMEGDHFKVNASIPGSPTVAFMNGALKIESYYQDAYYWTQTGSADKEDPEKTPEAFIKGMGEYEGEFQKVKCQKKGVKYALNYIYENQNKDKGITRIYVSKHKIYVLGVLGDLSLADAFFDSFEIQKD